MKADEITYTLSRHVPDMPSGFTISARYGDLEIPAGRLAKAITELVRKHFETELAKLALGQS